MKFKLLLICFCMLATTAGAQYLHIYTDKITGETYKETQYDDFLGKIKMFGIAAAAMKIVYYNDTAIFLEVRLEVTGSEYPIRIGNKMAIYQVGSDKPVVLSCVENTASNPRSTRRLFSYPRYKITKADLEILSKGPFEKVIIQTANKTIEDKASGGTTNKFRKHASIILTGKHYNGEDAIVKHKER